MVYTPPTSPSSSRTAFEPIRLLPPVDTTTATATATAGMALDQQPELEPSGSQSSSVASLEEEEDEPKTPPTPTPVMSPSPRPSLLNKHARSFSHDDIIEAAAAAAGGVSSPTTATTTTGQSSPRPRLHRRGHARGSKPSDQPPAAAPAVAQSQFIRLQPASPPLHSQSTTTVSSPSVHDISLHHRDDIFGSPAASSSSSLSSPDTTVWPQGDPKADALSPYSSPPMPKSFPSTNALNLEGVPTDAASSSSSSATPTGLPRGQQVDEEEDVLRVHQRSASSSGIYGPMAYTEKRGPLIRKKSGEPLRSSLKGSPLNRSVDLGVHQLEIKPRRDYRTKSAPATPLIKNVHFSSELTSVKTFDSTHKPERISRSGSPDETTEEATESYPFPQMRPIHKVTLHLPNFTKPPPLAASESRDLYVSDIALHADTKTLRGAIAVRNLAFHKRVAVRFTLDDWQTTSEVAADYAKSLSSGTYDEWTFSIKLSDVYMRIEDRKLVFAVRYCTAGQEIWDNNGGRNYVVHFKRHGPSPSASPYGSSHSSHTASASARSRRPASRRSASNYEWSAINKPAESIDHADDLKTSLNKLLDEDPVRAPRVAAKGSGLLSTRYDFGSAHPGRDGSVKTRPLNELAPGIVGGNQSPLLSPRSIPTTAPSLTGGAPVSSVLSPGQRSDSGRSLFATGYPFPSSDRLSQPVSTLYADATDDSEFGSDLNATRSERFNSFPPMGYSLNVLRLNDKRLDDKGVSEHVEHTVSPFAGGKRVPSPPPARNPLPDFGSPPASSDASYASPLLSPATSLDSPDLAQLQKSVGSGAPGEVQSYTGFLER